MANETFRLDAEFVVDATNAIQNFKATEKAAASFEGTLKGVNDALGNAFNVGKKGGLKNVFAADGKDVKNLEATLKVYKQLTDVVGGYGRAIKSLEGVDTTKANSRMETSLKGVRKALESVAKLSQDEQESLGGSLRIYKQLTDVHKQHTAAIRDKASALKALTVEQNKANKAAAGGGTRIDIDNLAAQASSTNTNAAQQEKAMRRMAQLRKEALKEMQADEARIATAQQKRFDAEMVRIAKTAAANKALTKQQEDAIRHVGLMQLQARRMMDAEFDKRAGNTARVLGLPTIDQALIAERKETERAAAAKRKAAEASNTVTKAQTAETNAHASTRYALYEVAGAYSVVAAAATAAFAAPTAAAVQYERAFADIVKVTSQEMTPALSELRGELTQMASDMPIAFEELTKISTAGAQMGIAEGNLASFTETVSLFVATSQGVNADQAAMSFGRLANMLQLAESDYNDIASAISEVGSASVATEAEILQNAESIATTANLAGFSADQVVGLSTALSSLKVRPEMARGAIQRVFAKINAAVAEGGEELENWARVAGVSAQQAEQMWRGGQASQFFQLVNKGLSEETDNIQRNITMRDQLGVTNVRDIELLARLSNGYEIYADSMALAGDAYARGDFLDKAAAPILATTATHLQRLANTFKSFLASMGSVNLAPINGIAEALILVLNALSALPGPVKSGAAMIALVVAGFAAMKAAMALSMAGMIAFRQVMGDAALKSGINFATLREQARLTFGGISQGAATASMQMTAFRMSLAMAQGPMAKARVAANGLRTALVGIGTVGWIGIAATAASVLSAIVTGFNQAEDAAKHAGDAMLASMGGTDGLLKALQQDAEEFANGTQTKALGEVEIGIRKVGDAALEAEPKTGVYVDAQGNVKTAAEDATEALDKQTYAIGKNADALMKKAVLDSLAADENQQAIEDLIARGFDFSKWQETIYAEGADGGRAYVEAFAESIGLHLGDRDWAQFLGNDSRQFAQIQFLEQLQNQSGATGEALQRAGNQAALMGQFGLLAAEDMDELNTEMGNGEKAADKFSEALTGVVDSMFAIVGGQAAVYEALDALGASLAENGKDFNPAHEAGRQNIEALQNTLDTMAQMVIAQVESGQITAAEGAATFEAYYNDLMTMLAGQGIDTSQFDFFRQYIDQLFADPTLFNVDTSAANQNLANTLTMAQQVAAQVAAIGTGTVLKPGVTSNSGTGLSGFGFGSQTSGSKVGVPRVLLPQQIRTTGPKGMLPDALGVLQSGKAAKNAELAAAAQKENEKASKAAAKASKDQANALTESEKMAKAVAEHQRLLKEAMDETMRSRYGFADSMDKVELQFISMREKIQSAKDEVKSLREEQRKLNQEAADARIEARQATLFAGIAKQYGDTERYEKYRNDADKANATVREKEAQAKAAGESAKALDKDMLSLKGNSKAAIENRGAVRSLQEAMIAAIIEYDNAGHSQEEVARFADNLKTKFKQQLTQMGYNEQQVEELSGVFKDLRRDILNVPTSLKIKAEADTAEAKRKIDELAKGRTVPLKFTGGNQDIGVTGNVNANDMNVRKVNAYEFGLGTSAGRVATGWAGGMTRARGGVIPGKAPANKYQDNLIAMGHGYDGVVSVQSGEGIVNRQALAYMGGPAWLDAVNNMRIPAFTQVVSGGGGSAGGSGIQMVEMLPHQMQQLASMISTIVTLDGGAIAKTTNAHNLAAARRGSN